jgi:exodeoxyribonuclease V alpha subunit
MSLEALTALHGAGLLRPVDLHFARLMAGYADSGHEAIALIAALLSVELGRGHVCVELAAVDGKPFAGLESPLAPRLDAAQLRAALVAEARLCAGPASTAPLPLVLDGDRVYLHRYWAGEGRVAARLRALATRPVAAAPDARALLDRLYPDDSGRQRRAEARLRDGTDARAGGDQRRPGHRQDDHRGEPARRVRARRGSRVRNAVASAPRRADRQGGGTRG